MDKSDSSIEVGVREERVAEGVYARTGKSGKRTLRIVFRFNGVTCRERLAIDHSPGNIKYAVRRRGEILSKIERRTFNYADEFPGSANARRFGFVVSDKLVGQLLDEYEARTRRAVGPSTWLGYSKIIEGKLRPWFGHIPLRDFGPAIIREKVLAAGIALKTARNALSPLNMALRRAVSDGELAANPLDRVDLEIDWPLDTRSSEFRPDPFAFEEMVAIFGACGDEEADYWRTAFGTGMRPSEQIELWWPRVVLATGEVRIEVARVLAIGGMAVKGPKTDAGRRTIVARAGALEALERQHDRTGVAGQHVFLDARYAAPWSGEGALRKRWARILKRADVRYRNPYQTRHTFASVLLAAGVPPIRVGALMGHEGTEMLSRHYGRWIEQGADPKARAGLAAFFSHPFPTEGKLVAFSL